jgi:hypothetical protein
MVLTPCEMLLASLLMFMIVVMLTMDMVINTMTVVMDISWS